MESFIRPAPQRYTRYYGQGPNQEPSQDNEEMRLVRDTLKLIGRDIDQIDIRSNHTALLITDAGDRVTVLLEPWDTPELLQPRLQQALEKFPVRWSDEQTAQDLASQGFRMERGGLE